MTGYKFLAGDGHATHGSGKWVPGKPRSVRGALAPCRNGIHYCRKDQLVRWLCSGPAIWSFEDLTPDETVDAGDKMVTRKGVVIEKFETWNDRTARLFAADCAERALRMVKKRGCRVDPRSINAVKAARLFAVGKISSEERGAAWAAARAAAWVAAAGDAAETAAQAAALAARAAAKVAAGDASRAAAWVAAGAASPAASPAAAWAAEQKWQTRRLLEILEGKRYA